MYLWETQEMHELMSVEMKPWEQPIQNFVGLVDIYYINQVYVHAQSNSELKELLDVGPPPLSMASSFGELFLDYQKHPPIVVDKAKLVPRKMDVVNISVSWYSAQLASAPPRSVTLWMHRLEMMMLSYIDKLDVGGIVLHFQEPIRWMNSGTMDANLCQIARWKQQDVCKEGLQLKTTEAKEETFG